jgi:hypothetical protein
VLVIQLGLKLMPDAILLAFTGVTVVAAGSALGLGRGVGFGTLPIAGALLTTRWVALALLGFCTPRAGMVRRRFQ